MAIEVPLYLDQGADFYKEFTAVDGGGIPIDLEGYTVRSQMRKYYGSQYGFTFESAIVDEAGGVVSIGLTYEDTELIPHGRYLYDVEITSPAGERYRLAEGIVDISPNITRI